MHSLRPVVVIWAFVVSSAGCTTLEHQPSPAKRKAPPITVSDDPKPVIGVDISAGTVRDIAQHNPPAAIAIWRFHPDHWTPGANLLDGKISFMGSPTSKTLDVMIERGSDEAMIASMRDLTPGTFQVVDWHSTQLAPGQLEARFDSRTGSSVESAVPSHPSVTIIVDKQTSRVLSFAIGTQRPALSATPPPEAGSVLHAYLKNLLSRDYERAAEYVHDEIKARVANGATLASVLAATETPLAHWYELGESRGFEKDRHKLVLFPARHVVKGFPVNVRMPVLLAVASDDGGASWGVVDNGCFDIKWAATLFPGFDESEFERVIQAPFTAIELVSVNQPKLADR